MGGGLTTTSAIGAKLIFRFLILLQANIIAIQTHHPVIQGILDLYFAGEFEIQTGLLLQLGLGYMQPNSFTAKGQFEQGVTQYHKIFTTTNIKFLQNNAY